MATAKLQTRKKLHVKKGDTVRVISGGHRGKEGKVLDVNAENSRVIVENVNMIKKTQKPTQTNPKGGFIEREAPIHASNVQLLDPKTNITVAAGYLKDLNTKNNVSKTVADYHAPSNSARGKAYVKHVKHYEKIINEKLQ